jgi:putative ABC transport system substrate-binding protein
MRRRQFILLCCAATITRPRAARAQKPDRVRIGVLMAFAPDDAEGLRRARVFSQVLRGFGWVDGQNAQIDYRWPDGDIGKIRAIAKELVGLRPDVLVISGTAQVAALQEATRTIPIVFIATSDPVGQGIVQSLARPGGNAHRLRHL